MMLGTGVRAARSGKTAAYLRTVARASPVALPIARSDSPAKERRRTSSYPAFRRARLSAATTAAERVRTNAPARPAAGSATAAGGSRRSWACARRPALDHLPRVEEQVPAVGDLDGGRRVARDRAPVFGRAVPRDEADPGPAPRPAGKCFAVRSWRGSTGRRRSRSTMIVP